MPNDGMRAKPGDRRLLFVPQSGVGMLRLVRRDAGWFLELTPFDRPALYVTDEEAERLTKALEEAGIRV